LYVQRQPSSLVAFGADGAKYNQRQSTAQPGTKVAGLVEADGFAIRQPRHKGQLAAHRPDVAAQSRQQEARPLRRSIRATLACFIHSFPAMPVSVS
jgi:hypothetical protein